MQCGMCVDGSTEFAKEIERESSMVIYQSIDVPGGDARIWCITRQHTVMQALH